MTPEENARKTLAEQVWDTSLELWPYYESDKYLSCSGSDLVQAVAQAIRVAKAEAYDEAIKAVCPKCAAGRHATPPRMRIERREIQDEMLGMTFGIDVLAMDCPAAAIHALKDSLVAETVSS
jgi:hypothetical protein